MPLMPMMPTGGDPMATSMMTPPPTEMGMPAEGGGLMGMLGGAGPQSADPMAGSDPSMMAGSPESQMMQAQQQVMAQFQQIEQLVMDLASMLPGQEQIAQAVMEDLDLWKRQAVMTMAPSSQAMPGASQML